MRVVLKDMSRAREEAAMGENLKADSVGFNLRQGWEGGRIGSQIWSARNKQSFKIISERKQSCIGAYFNSIA
jgi:hypothetical protein